MFQKANTAPCYTPGQLFCWRAPTNKLMAILRETMDSWNVAFAAIRAGHLIAFATDTVYGIACDPYNVDALDKLYQAKARDRLKAIPLLISSAERLTDFSADVPPAAATLAQRFWPGALTL